MVIHNESALEDSTEKYLTMDSELKGQLRTTFQTQNGGDLDIQNIALPEYGSMDNRVNAKKSQLMNGMRKPHSLIQSAADRPLKRTTSIESGTNRRSRVVNANNQFMYAQNEDQS